jgi:hypothetical protein
MYTPNFTRVRWVDMIKVRSSYKILAKKSGKKSSLGRPG